MVRTREKSTFRCVCVAVLSRLRTNTTLEATILDAAGPDGSVVSLYGGPHVLVKVFASYLGSGYRARLMEYPTFDLWLMKHYLRRTAASVFGSLDPFSKTKFLENRSRGAKTRDWLAFRPALRNAFVTNGLFMPGVVDVMANIEKVWSLVVSYLKETGRKDNGDSLVVKSSIVGILFAS